MKVDILIIIVLFIIIEAQVLWNRYKPFCKTYTKSKSDDALKSLITKQKEEDLVLEKEHDLILIDSYIETVHEFIIKYHRNRSKRIAYSSRQELLYKTISIIPIVSKYISLEFPDKDNNEFYNLKDEELLINLGNYYNDYTHDNLSCLQKIILIVIRIRDDKK